MLLKWQKGGLKSPMARARGLGTAHSGVDHWIAQRVTAVANIILTLWFVWSVVSLRDAGYTEILMWLSGPVNAVAMILLLISTVWHAVLGVQIITEDYVHHEGFKILKLLTQRLVYAALLAAGLFSVLQVAL